MLHSIYQQIWKTQQWPQDWEKSVFIPIPKKGNPKECSNYHIVALISHASKVKLNILQTRYQEFVNSELPDVQAGFRRGSEPEIKLSNFVGSSKKQERSSKHLFLLYWLCQSFSLCGSQHIVEDSERDRNTRPPDLPLEKSVCKSGSIS